MPITALHVANFKGLREEQTIKIRPLTIFIGPNSSGKSSCIHAIAALAQTVKLAGDPRPLVLDDEFAQVHLGRFIEVLHSKKYTDAMTLGIDIGDVSYIDFGEKLEATESVARGSARYRFRSTKTTQDTFLESAELALGTTKYAAKKVGKSYDISHEPTGSKVRADRLSGLDLDWRTSVSARSLNRTSLRSFGPLSFLQRALTAELRRTLYLGPFRQSPLRRYPTRGSTPTEVGAQGEATITMLANETIQSRSRTHIKQIASWLKLCGLAKDLDVARVARSDLFDVTLTLQDDDRLPIADLGYGLSQVLPVLTQCSFAPVDSTLLFEQPELHLHQIAAQRLATIFIKTIKEKKAHIVLETHSPDLLLQVVRELRDGSIALSDVAAYRVQRIGGRTKVSELEIDPKTFDIYEAWQNGLTLEV